MYRTVIEIEEADDGHHGIVWDADDDVALWISNAYMTQGDAVKACQDWIDTRQRKGPTMQDINGSSIVPPVARYAAYVVGTCCELSDSLDELVEMMSKDGRGTSENCVIWDSERMTVAALLQTDGSILVLDGDRAGRYRQAPPPRAKDDIDGRLKDIFLTRKRRS